MDFLNQNKLTKSEWETLEVPVPENTIVFVLEPLQIA
jgi:hypothetical protein